MQLQYSTAVPGVSTGLTSMASLTGSNCVATQLPLLTDCSQHTQPISQFGHQLLLQPQFGKSF